MRPPKVLDNKKNRVIDELKADVNFNLKLGHLLV